MKCILLTKLERREFLLIILFSGDTLQDLA